MKKILLNFLLLFKKKRYREVSFPFLDYPCTEVYKILFGRRYIFDIFPLPPSHPNCRCWYGQEVGIKSNSSNPDCKIPDIKDIERVVEEIDKTISKMGTLP